MTSKCPVCQKNEAQHDKIYALLPCPDCQEEARHLPTNKQKEFTSSTIKSQRREYVQSHLQPFYNGQLSREYIEAHGTDRLDVTQKDIKEAKYVYKHIPRWHKRNESKK
jgi:hypothetical protein